MIELAAQAPDVRRQPFAVASAVHRPPTRSPSTADPTVAWTAAERRTLWGVLGFIAGLALLGPVSALGAALLARLAARLAEPR
jgi:hypothetical protein